MTDVAAHERLSLELRTLRALVGAGGVAGIFGLKPVGACVATATFPAGAGWATSLTHI